MIRLYLIGICILVIAILANFIALKLSLKTWYEVFNLISENGISALKSLAIIDMIWLVIAYPLFLGLGYLLGDKIYAVLA